MTAQIIPFPACPSRYFRITTASRQIVSRAHELRDIRIGQTVRTEQGLAFVVGQDTSVLIISCKGIRSTLNPAHIVPALPEDGVA